MEQVVTRRARLSRLAAQQHARFVRRATALAVVAHVQRLVVLVQHQDSAHPLSPATYQKVRTGLNSPHVLDENDCSGYFSCRGRPAKSTYTSLHELAANWFTRPRASLNRRPN